MDQSLFKGFGVCLSFFSPFAMIKHLKRKRGYFGSEFEA